MAIVKTTVSMAKRMHTPDPLNHSATKTNNTKTFARFLVTSSERLI